MMAYSFSQRSNDKLQNVHPDLVQICHYAMDTQIMDFSVVEGARSLTRQRDLVAKGASKTMNSRHLIQDDGYAHAVDLYPYPINMHKVRAHDTVEICRFGVLAGLVKSGAEDLYKQGKISHKIRWGGDWDNDGETLDHRFFDAPHFELRH